MSLSKNPDRLQSLLSFLEKDPTDSFVKYGIALEYAAKEDYVKAEEYFQSILNDDPDYVPAYMQYARLKVSQNKIDEASALFQKGIAAAKKGGDKHAADEMEEFLNELK